MLPKTVRDDGYSKEYSPSETNLAALTPRAAQEIARQYPNTYFQKGNSMPMDSLVGVIGGLIILAISVLLFFENFEFGDVNILSIKINVFQRIVVCIAGFIMLILGINQSNRDALNLASVIAVFIGALLIMASLHGLRRKKKGKV